MTIGKFEDSAFGFEGNWKEFAPIALTNLLLTIVTLGIYRFWATTRERDYLWSRTRFIDDTLEWTGKGKELFIGFIMVAVLFFLPFFLLQFLAQTLLLQGQEAIAGALGIATYILVLFLFGLARFRAVRYRLSRTYWHGIRGGSNNAGFGYGFSSVWKYFAGYLPAGLLIPWSMCSLWNERWNKMSFGPMDFSSDARSGSLMPRFLLFYILPIVVIIGLGIFVTPLIGRASSGGGAMTPQEIAAFIPQIIISALLAYFFIGLVAFAYYAAFFREAVGNLSLGQLNFHFDARTKDWLILFLVDILLVVLTLGIGWAFLGYRHWKFFIDHLEATGEIELEGLTQSLTHSPKQGEGLLDALDVGAF